MEKGREACKGPRGHQGGGGAPSRFLYNTETALRLHREVGKDLGVNFDPSHFFLQGMDPALSILKLKDCIYHFHAKDSIVAEHHALVNGVLDYKPYQQMMERS